MRQSSSQPFYKSIDWVTILMYLIMVFFGWLSICGASYNFETEALLSPGGRPMMQLLWIGLGLVLGFAVISLDTDIYEVGAPALLWGDDAPLDGDDRHRTGYQGLTLVARLRAGALTAGGVREGRYRPHASVAMQSV